MRLRLTLSGLAVASLTLIVFWVLIVTLARSGTSEEQRTALEALAREAGRSGLVVEGPFAQVLTDPTKDTSPFVVLVDEGGIPVYSTARVNGAAPEVPLALVLDALESGSSQVSYELVPGTRVEAVAVPWKAGGGVAVAAQSVAFAAEQMEGVEGALAVATVLTLIVAAVVAWAISKRALRPLNTLVATADEIGLTGDLKRRLKPARRKDEVQKLTRSFNGMLDRLEQAAATQEVSLERQRRFVADASHELRTPLATIRSNAGFLLEHPEAQPADLREAAGDIVAESARMGRIVTDLLTLARFDSGITPVLESVDLADLAADVARRAGIDADTPLPAPVTGNPAALEQLMWILIDNARNHGAPPISVEVGVDLGTVTLNVDDGGPGVPPEHRSSIFERFHRVDGVRTDGGAGLGLAIAREIALVHRAEISIGDRPGGGARFQVVFPTPT
jgi:two-component system, OmpR family, sensor kinase